MRIRPIRHNECEITTDDGTRITVTVNAQPPADLKRFIELELAKIEPQWTAEGKGSYWWGVKIGLETVLAKLCENAHQPEHRRYDPYGSLSEYGIFPECDAQPPADDEVVFFDGVGAARSSVKSCRDGVQWIRVGDRVYWPLSDSDAKRLQSACCGNGSFDGPASPAGEGEEIMVNTPYGVFVLPLQPSELSSGPRFVVHVPSIEAPTVKALMEALETCLEMEERPEVIELAKAALAAVQRLTGNECHCGTCTCDPNMTPAVRFDLSPAQMEGAIRDHLIRLGWTPPNEQAMSQPAAPSETVNVVGMPEFDSLLDHIYEHGTAAEGVIEKANAFARAVIAQYASQQSAAVDEAMVERIATLLYEEATAEPSGPDRDYYRGLARKIAALVTTHQEPKP